MKVRIAALLGLSAGVLLAILLAGSPVGDPAADISYSAAQQSAGGNAYVLGAATASMCLRDYTTTTSRCDWFSPKTLVVLRAQTLTSGGVSCVASMTSTLTLGAYGGNTQCTATIGGTAYRNTSCVSLVGGERADQALDGKLAMRLPGARPTGICTDGGSPAIPSPLKAVSGENVYLGCTANGDCTDQSAGTTCTAVNDTTRRLLEESGAITFVCRAETASNVLTARAEQ